MGGKYFNFTFDTRNQKNKRVQSKESFDLWVNHWLDLDLLFVLSKKTHVFNIYCVGKLG